MMLLSNYISVLEKVVVNNRYLRNWWRCPKSNRGPLRRKAIILSQV